MNEVFNIQRLCQYLRIRDDEVLIIRHYNKSKDKDEFLLVKYSSEGLEIKTVSVLPSFNVDQPFRIIQQRDSSGKFVIPSVDQLIKDSQDDY